MKSKEFFIALLALLIAFGGLVIFKNDGKVNHDIVATGGTKSDSIEKFWDYYNLATQYRLQDKPDSAISAYREAINLNPSPEDPLYYLGIVYRRAGDFEKAKETWEKLTELDPGSERAFYQLGNLYFCMDHKNYFDPEKAKIFFNRAFQLNKEAVNPELRFGEIALFQNKMTEASAVFEKLRIMDHKNIEINFLTGYLQWKSGNTREGETNLVNAFTLIKAPEKNPSVEEQQDCDLFMSWIDKNLAAYQKQDVRTALPALCMKFDEYLKTIRQL